MRVLKISKIMPQQGFAIFCGVVEGTTLRTGDEIVVVGEAGERETALITSVAVDDPTEASIGARLTDVGKPGQSVRITLRRPKKAALDASCVVAFEKPAVASA